MCFLVIYIQPFLLLTFQKCLSEVRGPLVDLGVSEYGILSAITTLSETQNDLGVNQQQTSASTQLSYSADDITLFRQIALDLRKFSPGLDLMSDGTVSKGILATQNAYKLASLQQNLRVDLSSSSPPNYFSCFTERSFPTHRSLMGDSPEAIEGQAKLFRVLLAYAKYSPLVGYSQGIN